jgi:type IV secretion system protein VirB10
MAIAPVPSAPQVITRNVAPSLSSLGPDDLSAMGLQRIQPGEAIAPPPRSQAEFVAPAPAPQSPAGERVTASHLSNPGLTVPKGTIIAAVLETALDSSRPGAVRGIVSRDVRGFDGTRVLIPRGSRLYGEYASDVASGQNRALIRWQRLTRPDAVVINLDSPSADPLGRSGVRGKVDSHFFARFGSAILQSVLDIGVGLATRSIGNDDTVIVGLPGSTQQITGQLSQTSQVQPTLRVRQGTSVSVFVARDLDFSTVDD